MEKFGIKDDMIFRDNALRLLQALTSIADIHSEEYIRIYKTAIEQALGLETELPTDASEIQEVYVMGHGFYDDLYLNNYRKSYPRFNDDQEKTLGYALFEARRRVLTHEDEEDVSTPAQYGAIYDALNQIFAERNIGLVIDVSSRYFRFTQSREALVQSGFVGLMEAIKRYDVTKGNKFNTYAVPYIKKEVFNQLRQEASEITIEQHTYKLHKLIDSIVHRLTQEYGRSPTDEEVAYNLAEYSYEKNQVKIQRTGATALPREEYLQRAIHRFLDAIQAKRNLEQSVSVNEYRDKDALDAYIHAYEDEEWDEMTRRIFLHEIEPILLALTPRQERVIRLLFLTAEPKTIKEIAANFGLTGKRIRQIRDEAITSLKPRIQELGFKD